MVVWVGRGRGRGGEEAVWGDAVGADIVSRAVQVGGACKPSGVLAKPWQVHARPPLRERMQRVAIPAHRGLARVKGLRNCVRWYLISLG